MRLSWFPLLLLPALPIGAQSAQDRPATALGNRMSMESQVPGGTRDSRGVTGSCAREATPYAVLYVLDEEMILVVIVKRNGSADLRLLLHDLPLGERAHKPGFRVFLSL